MISRPPYRLLHVVLTNPTKQMSAHSKPKSDTGSLEQMLLKTDENLKNLFIRVMNLHAGYQIAPRSQVQLAAEVRKEIEESLSQKP